MGSPPKDLALLLVAVAIAWPVDSRASAAGRTAGTSRLSAVRPRIGAQFLNFKSKDKRLEIAASKNEKENLFNRVKKTDSKIKTHRPYKTKHMVVSKAPLIFSTWLLMTPLFANAARDATNSPGFFDPSAWIAAALFVIGGSLMFESIKSGGLQEDLGRIRDSITEKLGMIDVQTSEDSKLEERRKKWMNQMKEADRPKEVKQANTDTPKEEMTYDLDELFTGIQELEKKNKEME